MEPYHRTELGKLYLGDCLEVMKAIPDGSIDLVITDPPYEKKYFYLYEYLANNIPRLLKDGASFLTIVPHYSIYDVMRLFHGKLKYRWLLCMNQFSGKHARMAMGIEIMWKPILWYVKRAYPQGRGFLRDGVEIRGKEGQEKTLHKWQQDESWCAYYIEKLTSEGDCVLDPLCGSGTACVVAENLNRNWIGIDKEEEYCKVTKERLSAGIAQW